MDREIREGTEFSENVDRLLAGKEIEAGDVTGEDFGKAMSFSKKLVEIRKEPSPQFKARLKKQLLARLDGQQKEQEERSKITFWQVFRNLMPSSPVWRTATVTVMVGVLAVLVIWATGIFSQAPGTGTVTEGSEMLGSAPTPARLQLETLPSDTLVRSVGENFEVGIIFKNISADSLTIDPYPPEIEIQQADTNDVVRSFEQGTEIREIAPSEGLIYTLVWDQKDDGGQQVSAGKYTVLIGDIASVKDAQTMEAYGELSPVIELVIQ
jgi:hypothetical protein